MATGRSGRGRSMETTLAEDDFGLTQDVPEKSKWINPEGAAVATRGQVEQWKRGFFENVATLARVQASGESTQGELLHTIGTYLREIRGHSGWKAVGLESWDAFCEEHLNLSRRYANRLVAFAGAVSKAEAAFGVRKCLAGLVLIERLGLKKVGDLVPGGGAPEPKEWAALLGEPVRFATSPAARLERLLTPPKRAALPAPKPSRKTAALVARRREIVEQVTRKHGALEGLAVRSFARDGSARVHHRPVGSAEEIDALAALYTALAKG